MRTVCLIAKGPNAIHAEAYRNSGDAIATVNDSGRYISGPIDYAFASDGLARLRETQERISRIVTPSRAFDLPDWYQPQTHITYSDSKCCGDESALRERITTGGICHHHTTTGALHWLAKVQRYEVIRIIGVDGGMHYAPQALVNAPAMLQLRNTLGKTFLTDWKLITERLCGLLTEYYGTRIEFYA